MTTTPALPHVHANSCWWNPYEAGWVCHKPTETPLVDVRDMIVVHTALLREFRLASAAVRRVPASAPRSAAAVERHLAFVCELLDHHHHGEDTLLWPLLRERLPLSSRAMVEQAEHQHVDIDAALKRVAELRTAWSADWSSERGEELSVALERLHALLKDHLDLEESALLPLAATLLTNAEWGAIGAAAAAAVPKPALVLAMGMFAYEGDPEVLRAMISHAPPIPRLVVPRIAPRVYARRARQVHGTRRP